METNILVLVVEVHVGIVCIDRDEVGGKGGETRIVGRMGLHVFFG